MLMLLCLLMTAYKIENFLKKVRILVKKQILKLMISLVVVPKVADQRRGKLVIPLNLIPTVTNPRNL